MGSMAERDLLDVSTNDGYGTGRNFLEYFPRNREEKDALENVTDASFAFFEDF